MPPPPTLLAIVRDIAADEPRAALYDPSADRVVILRVGDSVLGRQITRITHASVVLEAAGQRLTLTLSEGGGTP